MYGPERVQTIEEYDSPRPRSNPARPGKLNNGTLQVPSRVSIPLPGWFLGFTRAEINDAAFAVADPFGTTVARIPANSEHSSNARLTFSRPTFPTSVVQ